MVGHLGGASRVPPPTGLVRFQQTPRHDLSQHDRRYVVLINNQSCAPVAHSDHSDPQPVPICHPQQCASIACCLCALHGQSSLATICYLPAISPMSWCSSTRCDDTSHGAHPKRDRYTRHFFSLQAFASLATLYTCLINMCAAADVVLSVQFVYSNV